METGDAQRLKQEIEGLGNRDGGLPLPVALVGSETKEMHSLDIFNVLCDLHLARPADKPDGEPEAHVKSKSKGQKDERNPPNQIKDKESGKVYVMDNRPSVIISITGDAQDLPDDDELTRGVDDLVTFCRDEQGLQDWVKLSRENASRAILSNFLLKNDAIDSALRAFAQSSSDQLKRTDGKKCLQISFLLQERIKALNKGHTNNAYVNTNFAYPSFRDMLLNIEKTIDDQLKSLNSFDFPNSFNSKSEPIACGKRLSKARYCHA